ncbi:hypothetical protein [Mesorhizobium sp. B2-3-15]|uniref:hypothetical protein n=1 Tax=Mesorhizobium sp. B2-3-15 TaxID=2589949 RepID=UPI001125B3D5|nr:hypothetical protein [Mesorhizobium sp. B2-3-15]TPL71390.1 hypothetical protein FJ954_17415 [Mesorhizobium sp. B2-3-15]
MRRETADLILSGDNLNYRRWLAQEVGDLASKISNLDAFSPMAILPLAKIAGYGDANASRLAVACDMELSELQTHLDALREFGFIEDTSSGFDITPLGERAFLAISRNIVVRERYELKGRLEKINRLYEKMKNLV